MPPRSSWFMRLLLGRPLASREAEGRKIGVIEGIPALGLDGLASSSYGPEAALTILMPLGIAGLIYIGPVILVILVLLVLLYLSYRQTIGAYPGGGGSYVVAKQNLGTSWGLIAAASLLLDYILNVAVAISAGVAALISAFPSLHPYTLPICLGLLVLLTLVNLRGTSEAGWFLAVPTYLFVLSFFCVLGLGLFRAISGGGEPQPVAPPPVAPAATGAVGVWLLMRSFASGCTAMTGVEAVANGTTAFREPVVPHARRTLTGIVVILGLLLAAIAYLAHAYHVMAMEQSSPQYQSVLSQLVAAIVGRGWVYYVSIGSLLAVLCLSANTSFVGFPRLCRLIAIDSFLPHAFAAVGRRLVYSIGILFLAIVAGLLLVVFKGITDRLIPLFAIGAFGAFTLSQAGMVIHWRRDRRRAIEAGDRADARRDLVRLIVNATGAIATGIALIVIALAKFVEGAWITLLAIPLLVMLFKAVKRHYVQVKRQLRTHGPMAPPSDQPPIVLLPTVGWDRLTEKSLDLALRLSPDVTAVHLSSLNGQEEDEEAHEKRLRYCWGVDVEQPLRERKLPIPKLELIYTPYREFVEPLVEFIERTERKYPDRQIAVMVPEIIKRHWWQFILHSYRAERLRWALLQRGDTRTVLINVPWYVDSSGGNA